MIFGEFSRDEAEGVLLAHTLDLGGKTLKKGRALTAADLVLLRQAGIEHVCGARLGADDLDENAAAAAIAALLAGPGAETRKPYTGRCNVHARARGVLRVDAERIDALNMLDEAIAIGTLPDHALARPGQVLASVKIIPFAVGRDLVERCRAAVSGAPPLRLAPLRPRRAALIVGELPGMKENVFRATVAATRQRLDGLGSRLALTLRCRHEKNAYANKLGEARAAGCDLLLVAGATVTKDRLDVVPAAVVAAGGAVDHFGMPVEPGNMLLLAHIGDAPVLALPGCARSRRTNGLDWVLQRLHAGLPLGRADIMRMGVGGLIRSPLEPEDEAEDETGGDMQADTMPSADVPADVPADAPNVAALVLAAGRSARMGGVNKLFAELDGVPLLLRAVNAALASKAASVTVVLGHEAERAEALLAGCNVNIVRNPDYADGMSTSLRAGLAALPDAATAAVVLLADMPRISAVHVDRLIDAHDAARPAILAPRKDGRRGNPVLWPREFFPAMRAVRGDQGARGVLDAHAERIRFIEFDDDAIHADIDTPDNLHALGER
ncbi:MAG: molybdopterin-binding/glycosyltransferase family 2 protein [Zoogloeaceae bacterium]|jgi:molybdenum cofactor cytidylyltransferase|nr:molybdopterin-binding/glycosyltransferase family 2 protein [Zoogloeaceae bacterium]